MNKLIIPILLILCLGFTGCDSGTVNSIPDILTSNVIESAKEKRDPNRNYICNVPVYSSEELAEMFGAMTEIEPDVIGAELHYDGAVVPSLTGSKTYYLTTDENCTGWGNGILSVSSGLSLAFAEDDIALPLAEYMKNGNPCTVYAYSDTSYTKLELIFTSLPVISIVNDGTDITFEERKCGFYIFQPRSGEQAAEGISSPATLRIRGASSSELVKVGYALELYKEDYSDTDKISLLSMRKDDDWILYPSQSDETKIRDAVAWEIWDRMCTYNNNGNRGTIQLEYVEIILNGEYFGLYVMMEKFDDKTLGLSFGDSLFKGVTWDIPSAKLLRSQTPDSEACEGVEKKYPDPSDIEDGSWSDFADFIEVVYESSGEEFASTIDRYVDVNNMLDYWLFLQIIMGPDNIFKNTYYAVIDGKVYAFPWDLDITFGLVWGGVDFHNYLRRNPNVTYDTFDFNCGRRLLKYYPGAATYVKNRWNELKDSGLLTEEGIMAIAEPIWNELHDSGAYARNLERWPDTNTVEDLTYFRAIVKVRMHYLDVQLNKLEDAD